MAKAGGLAVNRGIITGRDMQSSAGGIYAAGDCAEVVGGIGVGGGSEAQDREIGERVVEVFNKIANGRG